MNDMIFLEESPVLDAAPPPSRPRWKIIIADDEPEIHFVTRFALTHFDFEGAKLEFLQAYSANEALSLVAAHPDAAVLLLDVVMESENAGLDIVPKIRKDLNNHMLRIVLRTGQPGVAPEAEVIRRYDINDYREKTEMTGLRLTTVLYSCLRAFRDMKSIEASKAGLEKIIEASAALYRLPSVEKFAEGVLDQLDALLHLRDGSVYAAETPKRADALAASGRDSDELRVLAATGAFSGSVGKPVRHVLSKDRLALVREKFSTGDADHVGDRFVGVYHGDGSSKLLFAEGCAEPSELDRKLLKIFSTNISVGFENLQLRESIEETQREIAYRLSGAVESRSKETANHIRRVAHMSAEIGRAYGLSEHDAEVLRHASPLHDVGKVGIPDHVLNKPGKHSPEEWEIMKTHAQLGHDLLSGSDQEILQIGGLIALEHHERWDGEGYPYRKSGKEISPQGRIVAAIDVFDALGSQRCYKDAWPMERILDLFRAESGRHFDPEIVDLMFHRMDDLLAIRERYPDHA
jgi:response regulator RpfG family c-di-GMP phosphodiesterase